MYFFQRLPWEVEAEIEEEQDLKSGGFYKNGIFQSNSSAKEGQPSEAISMTMIRIWGLSFTYVYSIIVFFIVSKYKSHITSIFSLSTFKAHMVVRIETKNW